LLSLSRFLFMAEYPHLCDPEVLAEMRGVIDDQGRSPFWDALGKHFFDLEFPKADYLSVINKEFIGDLMPRYPIYIPLHPPEAQRVIGEVHELTMPALKLLEAEGFQYRNFVDIFEAGPMVHCSREQIRSVRDSRRTRVVGIGEPRADEPEMLIASRTGGFRCCRGRVRGTEEGVEIDQLTADLLGVGRGDDVRYVPIRPHEPG
jgi:arginine N-succinyltransferase